jgi:hypothetical protein
MGGVLMTIWRTMTRAEFDVWHAEYLNEQGYPLPGRNAATGKLAPAPVGVTTAYTSPIELADSDCRFTVMFEDEFDPETGLPLNTLPGEMANDPSWFFDSTLETLWVDADAWAAVDVESQQAFMAFPDPETCLGEPRDVIRDDIDYVVFVAATVTEDHLLALAEVLP